MIKYVFSILLALSTFGAFAQKKSVVILQRSNRSENVKRDGEDVIKVYQGSFKQDYSIMTSDSAYFYPQRNAFDAFGNVHITQGDTLNIYSDKLNYNGNTKVALLTNNVRMIDKDAILTTNYLTYNTATRIGTYLDGGKLINKENVLTSKNGYYFARSRDAYFRYNVVLVTPDALIKTDTLRYNTGVRIAYFLGPSNIYDTKDKKDTLYTENGLYNTITEQAFFGKKNLYKSGTKRLKGDSLFYDKVKGFGKAVKHVVFTDTEQKIMMTGDLITYFKADESTIATIDPTVVVITEERDTTAKADSAFKADSVANSKKKPTGTNLVNGKPVSVNLPTVGSVALPGLSMPVLKGLNKDTTVKVPLSLMEQARAINPRLKLPTKDTVIKIKRQVPPGSIPIKSLAMPQLKTLTAAKDSAGKPKERVKRDSVYISADSLETKIMTYKDYKIMLEKLRLSHIRDTTVKVKKPVAVVNSKLLTASFTRFKIDTAMYHKNIFGKPKAAVAGKPKPKRRPEPDPADDEPEIRPYKLKVLSDTARIRIVIAHHHAKLFKSDLQAKADSMFYSYSDSTIRCYLEPIIWARGSQLSGDTIYMQMHNKKLDNLDLFPQALIVNIEKQDSIHFNQVAGKRMKGYFRNDKLDRMYVTGNAESIYFTRDSLKVKEMQRSLSSRMRIRFKNNSASNITFLIQPDHRFAGLSNFKEDERILKSFKWKPKDRPVSKESILPSYNRKHNPPPAKTGSVKPGLSKKPPIGGKPVPKMVGDTTLNKQMGGVPKRAAGDSINIKRAPVNPIKKDSTVNSPTRVKKDSVERKKQPVAAPEKTPTADSKKPAVN
ncbi:OstA-like protein [Mucilaginibacter glaciei]|uniref:Organic solvent tolerance-like N-terminal domain-containing protein n=1 Tax=Mucilaginibacter glaciei TaxID=2772109 RepID=A0A926S1H7_9SPHI|nr:OstA-like protein [Mucilaginibacter glaciei]MBD1394045.1 hypothetical protein [Mucilaginibacter glaciei]